jgi:pyridoxine 4-dehydrogenase
MILTMVNSSSFATEVLHNGVAAACAQYNIPLIAYSPIGKGMLSGKIRKVDDIVGFDMLKHFPRFQPDNLATNLQLVEKVEEMAKKKGCTPAQLAINWTIALSRRPGMPVIIPIPGATTVERVEENSKLVDISDEEMKEIDEILAKFETAGARYPDHIPTDT